MREHEDVEPRFTLSLTSEGIDRLIQSWLVGKKGLLEACTQHGVPDEY